MSVKLAAYPKCYEYDIGLHRTMTIFEWIDLAGQHLDVDGLEMYERFLTSFDADYLDQVRTKTEAAGFTIPMFICSPDFTNPDLRKRLEAIRYQKNMIRVTYALGGEGAHCRILSGQRHPNVSVPQGVAWVVEAINEVLPVARQYGIVLAMENHYKDSQWEYPEFAQHMEVFLKIVDAIDDTENFGVQFDPSNSLICGEDPLTLLRKVSTRVVTMHASDRFLKNHTQTDNGLTAVKGYGANLSHGVVGKGLNDYGAIFKLLAKSGFDGWISIEDGLNGIAEMQESAVYLRKLIQQFFPA